MCKLPLAQVAHGTESDQEPGDYREADDLNLDSSSDAGALE
ncbi:hypothetical protein AB0L66_40680 [Streptomyces sp. NPDC052207]